MLDLPEGFASPDWTAPLDLDEAFARVPEDAKTRGMFVSGLQQICEKRGVTLRPERRYYSFKQYPLSEFMEVALEASEALYPAQPVRERLRRLGGLVYPNFYDSRMGKFLFGVLGRDIKSILKNTGAGYKVSLTRGEVECLEVDDHKVRLAYTDVFNFLDSYHVGIVESVLDLYDHVGRVGVKLESPIAAEFCAVYMPNAFADATKSDDPVHFRV